MTEIVTALISLLAAMGIGSILGAYFQARFQQRAKAGEQEHEFKQKRYKTILILMLMKLSSESGREKARAFRPELKTDSDIDDELTAELLNSVVFASQLVLESLASFIRTPSKATFVTCASSMRKDLWGKRAVVSPDLLDLLPSPK